MPANPDRPSPSVGMQNLLRPMPLGKKMASLWRNILIRLRNRSDCCGHPGEPGC